MDVTFRAGDDVDYFQGAHTGYRRLTPPLTVTEAEMTKALDILDECLTAEMRHARG